MIAPSALRAIAQRRLEQRGDVVCDPQIILALLDAVEAATDLITNAADSSRDVKLEARRRLIAALAPFTETQT